MRAKGMCTGFGLVAVVVVMLGLSGSLRADTILNVIDLGTLGGTESRAYGLNSSGDVTGSYMIGGINHAFVWHDANNNQQADAGEMQDLGTFGGSRSVGRAINDSGQVTGWADLTSGQYRAFVWTDGNGNWQRDPGEMINLGTLGTTSGTLSVGYGINNAGQVAGLSYLTLSPEKRRAFRWTDTNSNGVSDAGEMVNLGTLGSSTASQSFGLDTQGDVVGLATDISDVQQSFCWIDGDANGAVGPGELVGLVSLDVPSAGYDINESGEIAGYFETGGLAHAYYYNDSDGMLDINPLLGATESWAYAVNDDGMVCGTFVSGGVQRAFVYDPETNEVTDLNDILPAGSPWVLLSLRDIEGDLGCGWGYIGGEVHAFMAIAVETQVPEPMTLTLVGGGLVVLLWRRRRS